MHHLAAREIAGWLDAGNVVSITFVDELAAGHVFRGHELERTGSNIRRDRLRRVGKRILFTHDEQRAGGWLGEAVQHEGGRLVSFYGEGLVVHRRHLHAQLHQACSHHIALRPAADRRHSIGCPNWGAVMKLQPRSQDHGIDATGRISCVGVDHLWLRLALGVLAEQRVVDHVCVLLSHGDDAGHGIEHRNLGLWNEMQGSAIGTRLPC